MNLQTAASVISCVSRIEQEGAALYEKLADAHPALKTTFLAFAKENLKHEAAIRRAYYNVVSDALETGFCFDLAVDEMLASPPLPPDASLASALDACMLMEEKVRGFYVEAAAQSKSLLADVSRAMERVAKARTERQAILQTSLQTILDKPLT